MAWIITEVIMVASIKTNTAPAPVLKYSEQDAFNVVSTTAIAASKASVKLTAAITAWLIRATHFADGKDKLTAKVARKQLEAHLANAKNGVQDQMLTRYIQVAFKLRDTVVGTAEKPSKHKATLQMLANCATAQDAANAVESFCTNGLKVSSLNKLREAIGIPVGEQNSSSSGSKGKKLAARAASTMKGIAQAFSDGKSALSEAQQEKARPVIVEALAQQTPVDVLIDVILKSLDRLKGIDTVKPSDVMRIATAATEVAKIVASNAKIRAAQPKATKALVAAVSKGKGKGKPARVTAH
jgi:hypothetical protein